MWPSCSRILSSGIGLIAASSLSISARPRMTPSGFLRSWAIGAEHLALELVGAAQPDPLRGQPLIGGGQRAGALARRAPPAARWRRCSCSYRMTLSNATESRLQNTSTSERSVADSGRCVSSSTTTSRPLPVLMYSTDSFGWNSWRAALRMRRCTASRRAGSSAAAPGAGEMAVAAGAGEDRELLLLRRRCRAAPGCRRTRR